jgi:hypothetical protein
VFCDLLANNDKSYFSGKTVCLGADIEVSRMAGSDKPFSGTFDGQGNTLTLNYGTAFILADGNHGINWYRLAEDHYTLKANSAYLRLSASVAPSASRSLTMVFEDSTTGVTTASSLNGGEWYDLNGRKLFKKPTRKGLYIFNGRKTLIVYGRCKKGGGMHAVIPKSFVPLHP